MGKWMMVAMVVVAGCGSVDGVEGEADTIDESVKADGTFPLGNYAGTVRVGQIRDLTLNSDKSFARLFQTVDCIPAPCRAEEGSYKFSHSSINKYLRFYDEDGNFIERWVYKLSGDKLSLRRERDSNWFYVTKTQLSTLGDSCGGFTRYPRRCVPGLECVYSGVPDLPGKCERPGSNPCVAAGGACVALYPGACDGEVANAREFSCGGGLGVECCFKH